MKPFIDVVVEASELHKQGNFEKAAYLYEHLLGSQPDDPVVLYLYGTLCSQMKRFGTAIQLLSKSVLIEPKEQPEAWHNLGVSYRSEGHTEAAIESYRRCLALRPEDENTLSMLAGCFINAGNPGLAIDYAKRSLAKNPDNPHAHNHLALGHLELGHYKTAWPHYERRYELTDQLSPRPFTCPKWDGKPVRKLAIHGEQGLGDEIMFMSCLADAAELADEIVIECAPRLTQLFEQSFGYPCYGTYDALVKEHPDCDAYVPMGSLPTFFRQEPADFPGTPYITPDLGRIEEMAGKLEKMGDGPYVGIAWYGGTKATHQELRNPDLDLFKQVVEKVRALGGTPVSVQYGDDGAPQAKILGIPHWKYAIDDLPGQAALVKALDLVISPCQTVIHLAGAVGTECWCLTPSAPAWRYKMSGPMDWYRSVTLMRQEGKDWSTVFERVLDHLDNKFAAEQEVA